MKTRTLIAGIICMAAAFCLTGCGKERAYQKEITEAWTKTNSYASAGYTYSNSYINGEGASVKNRVEGAYNKDEKTWSQITAYGTEGTGKMEEVFSPKGVFVRYNLDGENWESWGKLEAEVPDYATYLLDLFQQEISFENFASMTKEETEKETVYTFTYKTDYMEAQVQEDLQAAEAYTEVLNTSGATEEELKSAQARVENLKMMAGAKGQVVYSVDKAGNLTGISSKMLMKNGAETSSSLQLTEFGEISFEGYIQNP